MPHGHQCHQLTAVGVCLRWSRARSCRILHPITQPGCLPHPLRHLLGSPAPFWRLFFRASRHLGTRGCWGTLPVPILWCPPHAHPADGTYFQNPGKNEDSFLNLCPIPLSGCPWPADLSERNRTEWNSAGATGQTPQVPPPGPQVPPPWHLPVPTLLPPGWARSSEHPLECDSSPSTSATSRGGKGRGVKVWEPCAAGAPLALRHPNPGIPKGWGLPQVTPTVSCHSPRLWGWAPLMDRGRPQAGIVPHRPGLGVWYPHQSIPPTPQPCPRLLTSVPGVAVVATAGAGAVPPAWVTSWAGRDLWAGGPEGQGTPLGTSLPWGPMGR